MLKRVRFTCCSSTSTCAKSVLTVRSAVKPVVIPYLRSKPASDFRRLSNGVAETRSVVSDEIAYGLTSRLSERAGASSPRSVACAEILKIAARPNACGIGVRYERSFFHATERRIWIPQSCGPAPA